MVYIIAIKKNASDAISHQFMLHYLHVGKVISANDDAYYHRPVGREAVLREAVVRLLLREAVVRLLLREVVVRLLLRQRAAARVQG
jgi:hypothetical protein